MCVGREGLNHHPHPHPPYFAGGELLLNCPTVLVVAWARVPHRICWCSYDVIPHLQDRGITSYCANTLCVGTRTHVTSPFFPVTSHSLTSLLQLVIFDLLLYQATSYNFTFHITQSILLCKLCVPYPILNRSPVPVSSTPCNTNRFSQQFNFYYPFPFISFPNPMHFTLQNFK